MVLQEKIKTLLSEYLATGSHPFELAKDQLPPAIYLLRVIMNAKTTVVRIAIE
jgi:hypothetical protein